MQVCTSDTWASQIVKTIKRTRISRHMNKNKLPTGRVSSSRVKIQYYKHIGVLRRAQKMCLLVAQLIGNITDIYKIVNVKQIAVRDCWFILSSNMNV